ncbi:MAG: hypothetical protein GY810_32305 [Aureispira sp.]|nr:hypothetical protein [Aureispira sp.]
MLDPQVLDAPDLAKRQYQFDTLDRMGTAVSVAGFGLMGAATIGNIINNGPVFALLFLVMLWMFAPVRYFLQYYRWTKGVDTKGNLIENFGKVI